MATIQFKVPSPYKVVPPPPPVDDIKYSNYLRHLECEDTRSSVVHGFAIFGIGRAGTIHLSYLAQNKRAKILYIVDDDTLKADKIKKYWNLTDTKFLTSANESVVYTDPEVRAVVVCTPTFTHEKIVKSALDNNKAVFCEKPVAESIEQAVACYNKAKQVNQPLLSAFNRRFDPSYSAVRNRVRRGEVGQVLTVKTCSRDSPLPSIDYLKISHGIYHDCIVHDIDIIIFILGEYPTKVSVMAKANIPEIAAIDDHDTVAMILSFDSGALGIIDVSRHSSYGYDQRLEVFGQKGMLRAENKQQLHNIEKYTHTSVERPPIDYSFPSRFDRGYEEEMDHFIRVLEGKEHLLVDAKTTLAVTKIAAACEESAKSGRVVEIKWSKEELP